MQSFTPLTKINKLTGKITVEEKQFIQGILLTGKVMSGEKLLSVLLLWTATTLKKKLCEDKLKVSVRNHLNQKRMYLWAKSDFKIQDGNINIIPNTLRRESFQGRPSSRHNHQFGSS